MTRAKTSYFSKLPAAGIGMAARFCTAAIAVPAITPFYSTDWRLHYKAQATQSLGRNGLVMQSISPTPCHCPQPYHPFVSLTGGSSPRHKRQRAFIKMHKSINEYLISPTGDSNPTELEQESLSHATSPRCNPRSPTHLSH